jgi:hypothetical protein
LQVRVRENGLADLELHCARSFDTHANATSHARFSLSSVGLGCLTGLLD